MSDSEPRNRDESWMRRKPYIGMGRPGAAPNGYEKWPRFCGEVPPEIAGELDTAIRRVSSDFGRADAVRSGLRMWLNRHSPEPEKAIEGTATEIVDLPSLEAGHDDSREDRQ